MPHRPNHHSQRWNMPQNHNQAPTQRRNMPQNHKPDPHSAAKYATNLKSGTHSAAKYTTNIKSGIHSTARYTTNPNRAPTQRRDMPQATIQNILTEYTTSPPPPIRCTLSDETCHKHAYTPPSYTTKYLTCKMCHTEKFDVDINELL